MWSVSIEQFKNIIYQAQSNVCGYTKCYYCNHDRKYFLKKFKKLSKLEQEAFITKVLLTENHKQRLRKATYKLP